MLPELVSHLKGEKAETARNQGRNINSEREVSWTQSRNRQSPRKEKLTERPLETARNQGRNMNRVEGPQKRARNQDRNRLCLSSEVVEVRLRGVTEDKLPETARNQGRNMNRVEGMRVEKLIEIANDQGRNMNSVVAGNQGRNKHIEEVDMMMKRPLEMTRNQGRNMNRVEE